MEITLAQSRPAEVAADALVVNLFEREKPAEGALADLDRAVGGAISRGVDLGDVKGKLYETSIIYPSGGIAAPRLLIVGAGARKDFTVDRARNVAGTAARFLARRVSGKVALWLQSDLGAAEQARAATEGAILGTFDPGMYKTKPENGGNGNNGKKEISELALVEPSADRAAAAGPASREGKIVGDESNYARTLINMPANLLPPQGMADEARKAAELGLEVDVLDRDRMAELGMGSLLGVAEGADVPPYLIVMRYNGAGPAPYLGLVGKGVMFDSGGISIKPAENMHLMKDDMSGAAAVLAAMRAIAQLKPKSNVLGVMPCVENMPSGHSYRPGDVLRAMNGKTIEVLNTDAEGRLVLADAVAYAQKLGAARIVDAATLTGAVVVALGHVATGVLGTPQDWVGQVMAAAAAAGEKMWQLPLFEEYGDQIKSEIADVANSGGRPAGTITGALFIKEFVADNVPWVHLDIAGTSWTEKGFPYLAKGPTGVGVRTFVRLAQG